MLSSANDMLSCHRVVELLLDYLEGDLDAKLQATMDQHFEMCPGCVEFTAQYRRTSKICREELIRAAPTQITDHVIEFLRKNLSSS
jgi:anti-sigma factor RsiW